MILQPRYMYSIRTKGAKDIIIERQILIFFQSKRFKMTRMMLSSGCIDYLGSYKAVVI